jgi:hypothetical protein
VASQFFSMEGIRRWTVESKSFELSIKGGFQGSGSLKEAKTSKVQFSSGWMR